MFMGVLGYVKDLQVMHSIIDRVIQAVPSGSYLVLWDGTATGEAMWAGNDRLAEGGAVPYYLLSLAELAECFAGLDLVEPGMRAVRRSGRSGNSSTGSDGEFERARRSGMCPSGMGRGRRCTGCFAAAAERSLGAHPCRVTSAS